MHSQRITCHEESKGSENGMGESGDRSSHRGDHKRIKPLVGKAECKRPFDVNKWIGLNSKMYLIIIKYVGVDWIHLAQNMDHRLPFLNTE